MPKPTIGQPDWGGVLNDHLDSLDANISTKASSASVDALTTEVATKQPISTLDADVAAKVNTAASASQAAVDARVKDGRNARVRYLDDQPGVALDGATECGAAIQSAISTAEADGVYLVAGRRVYVSASTLTIKKSCNFYESTISYSGATGTAVVVGDDVNGITRQDVRVGRVVNTAMGTGWGAVAGSIGVKIVDTTKSFIRIKSVVQFETGVQVLGQNRGCVYNTLGIEELQTNKVNMEFKATTLAGFTNSNHIVGGSWNHDGTKSGGTGIAGTRHVLMHPASPGPVADTNTFTACHFEGNTVEYMVESYGKMNTFRDCRWEALAPKVLWQSGSFGNAIRDGYKPELVEITNNGDPDNTITWPASGDLTRVTITPEQMQLVNGTGARGAVVRHPVFNVTSAASDILAINTRLPANWHTYDVELHIVHDVAAGAGTTLWLWRPTFAGDGDILATPAGGTTRTVSVAGQKVVKVSTIETGLTATAGKNLSASLVLSGGTFANTVGVLAVVLRKRS